ncbi:MAG: hypothetical protein ACE5PM_04565 [Candidatus Hydrothermarchaeales archaeon]
MNISLQMAALRAALNNGEYVEKGKRAGAKVYNRARKNDLIFKVKERHSTSPRP